MALITAVGLSKSYGAEDLFSGVSVSIPKSARIALVGPNGVGKTTLLRILADREGPSTGKVSKAKGLQWGYLTQESVTVADGTLWDECLISFQHVLTLGKELEDIAQQLRLESSNETLIDEYGKKQEIFEQKGGYTYQSDIQQVLGGLGFKSSEFHMPLLHLSGGQRTRALLARLLLDSPDLLILDEPTNHLDYHAVEWLESFLSKWDGAVLIVSHDRYFIDRSCNSIWDMSRNGIEVYSGNYTAYVLQREDRWKRRETEFDTEIERLFRELDYVKRNIAGQRTNQAKGKLKRLSRQIVAIEQIGFSGVLNKKWGKITEQILTSVSPMRVDEAHYRIKALKSPVNRLNTFQVGFKLAERSGDIVLRTAELKIGYPGKMLFEVPELEFRRKHCVALMGPNGSGKTTFLKTILGDIAPYSGTVRLGASLIRGYFSQAHEDLTDSNTVIEEIAITAPGILPGEIRNYLGQYLFRGDDVFKKVGVLSGGERGRLALAKLALSETNLLLLDEPTNHLDVPSQEMLQQVLNHYQGTIMLVSHDRYLIDALADTIWEIDTAERVLKTFAGNYSSYREYTAKKEPTIIESTLPDARRKRSSKQRKSNKLRAEQRKREARLRELTKMVTNLEAEKKDIEVAFTKISNDLEEVTRLGQKYVDICNNLDDLYEEWENLHE